MEVQLTDFENAAFVVFVVLVTRVVLAFDLCLYIPLSKVIIFCALYPYAILYKKIIYFCYVLKSRWMRTCNVHTR
jgi:hypothetical protein